MPAREFKARCSSLLQQVNKTKARLTVTRHGKAILTVIPTGPKASERNWIGSMLGRMEITGDILSPVIEAKPGESGRSPE